MLTKLVLLVILDAFRSAADSIIATTPDRVISSANLRDSLLSWQALVCLLLFILIVFIYMAMDLLAQILLCDNIIEGRRTRTFSVIKEGFKALPAFLSAGGIPVLIYILIAVPLVGIGFSISLTKGFKIPSFIMDVIVKTPLYLILYGVGILLLIWLGFRYIFTLPGVMLDHMSVKEAKKQSVRLIRKNWKHFIPRMLLTLLKTSGLLAVAVAVFSAIPLFLTPKNATEQEGVRFLVTLIILLVMYSATILTLITGGLIMMRFTHLYRIYTLGPLVCKERPKRSSYFAKALINVVAFIVIFIISVALTLSFETFFPPRDVGIVAHRAGGDAASENSIDGIEAAIALGDFGSETDIQRTADGAYIINHDNTFSRLAGVDKKPSEMTLAEIKALSFPDTTGNGKTQTFVTLEEMLDAAKDRIKLFVEMKGETADTRMVDDVVRIIREKDCVDDVVLISLDYDIINYAETTYPEFDTGVLLFASYGDLSALNCDYILIEEQNATATSMMEIHLKRKKVGVWTLNSSESLYKYLDSNADVVITDSIDLADTIVTNLAVQSDSETIIGRFMNNRRFREIICDFFDGLIRHDPRLQDYITKEITSSE